MAWRSAAAVRAAGGMESGERDRMITLQQRPVTDTVSESGFPIETWTTLVASMPASRIDLGGQEQFRAAQMSAAFDTRWEINYRADMDPELIDVPKLRRVLYRGAAHDIIAASQIGRREGVELLTLAATGA